MSRRGAASKHFAEQNHEMGELRPPISVLCGAPARPRRVGCGDSDGFINAYLTQLVTGELKK